MVLPTITFAYLQLVEKNFFKVKLLDSQMQPFYYTLRQGGHVTCPYPRRRNPTYSEPLQDCVKSLYHFMTEETSKENHLICHPMAWRLN